ncbi:MAG: thioredoxin, partial [Butyricicoccaceae bacterium]
RSSDMSIITLTEENFESAVLRSARPVLVDFYAIWCGPCKALAPVIEEIAHAHQHELIVGKVDTDAQPALAARYQVSTIPTLLLFRQGVVVDRMIGAQPKSQIERMLSQ